MRRPGPMLLVSLALVGLTWAVYAPVRHFGFVAADDPFYVAGNPHLVGGPGTPPDRGSAAVRYALTAFTMGNWNPLVWASYFADRWAFGLAPGPMHVENVAVHAAAAVLLLAALAGATGRPGRSAVVAAVFAVHPMHVESVAWVSERKDALSVAWLFAAVWAYVRFARAGRRRWAWYAVVLACYALSLSAKSTGVTLAGVLLLLDAWPLGRLRDRDQAWRRVLEKVPLLLMALATAAVTVAAQRWTGAVQSLDHAPLDDRLANAVLSYVAYAAKLAWPARLACFYPPLPSFPPAAVAAAALLLGGVTAAAVRLRRRRPYLLVGWLWFLGTLVPMIGLVQVGDQSMADRYAYLPSVGLSVAVVWLLADALPARVATAAGVAAVVALAVAGRQQVWHWRDNRALFGHAIVVTDGNYFALRSLGRDDLDRGDLPAATAHLTAAVTARPAYADAVHDLGLCAELAGDHRRAAVLYERAVRLAPADPQFRVDLAAARAEMERLSTPRG